MDKNPIEEAAERVLALEAETETSGTASTQGDALSFSREQLHKWVDSVVGVVSMPGVGRVALIHENGQTSSIASPNLPYLLARPINYTPREE